MAAMDDILYNSVDVASWAVHSEVLRADTPYDVIDHIDSSNAAVGNRFKKSVCSRLWHLLGLSGTPLPSGTSLGVHYSNRRYWHGARHGDFTAVGTYSGIQLIRFNPDDKTASIRDHDLFEIHRVSGSVDVPTCLTFSASGRYFACAFSGHVHVYDSSNLSETLRKMIKMPINGTIVGVEFVQETAPPVICVVTQQAVVYSIDLDKAVASFSGDSAAPRRSLSDSIAMTLGSFSQQYSLQHVFEHLVGAVFCVETRTLLVFSPKTDPSASEIFHTEDPRRVDPRLSIVALRVAVDPQTHHIDLQSQNRVLRDEPIAANFTPSSRLANILGHSRSILSRLSKDSIAPVHVRISPGGKFVATLDAYGHLSLFGLPHFETLGAMQLPSFPTDIAFWSDNDIAIAFVQGIIKLWSFQFPTPSIFDLTLRSCPPVLFMDDAKLELFSSGRSDIGELYVLQSRLGFLRPRRSWPEAESKKGESDTGIFERSSFALSCLSSVSPEKALQYCLSKNQYDTALSICVKHGLSTDPVYKRQWERSDVNSDAITAFLVKVVHDPFWSLEQCRVRCGNNADDQRRLLEFGISLTDNASKTLDSPDAVVWAYRLVFRFYLRLLATFIIIQDWDPERYISFRSTTLVETAKLMAASENILVAERPSTLGNVDVLAILFSRHRHVLYPHLLSILDCIPEAVPVSTYACLIPHQTLAACNPFECPLGVDWVEADPGFSSAALSSPVVQSCSDLKSWEEYVTAPILNSVDHDFPSWFIRRTIAIDSHCGLVSNALDLIEIAFVRYLENPEIRHFTNLVRVFARFVYEWDPEPSGHHSLADFVSANSLSRVQILLSGSSASTIVDNIRERLIDQDRQEALLPYLIRHVAPHRPALLVPVLAGDVFPHDQSADIARLAIGECMEAPGDLNALKELGVLGGDERSSRIIKSVEISARRNRPHSPKFFSQPPTMDAVFDVVRKLIDDEVASSNLSSLLPVGPRYAPLLNDVYAMVGSDHVGHAQEIFLASVFSHSEYESALQLATLVDAGRFQKVALAESRRLFNQSQTVDTEGDASLVQSRIILALCDHSADVAVEKNLHSALCILHKIGVKTIKPIELRSESHRAELLGRVISILIDNQIEGNVQIDALVEFCRLLGINDAQQLTAIQVNCAREMFLRSPTLQPSAVVLAAESMATHAYADGWQECTAMGDPVLLRHAVWACPVAQLTERVRAARAAALSPTAAKHPAVLSLNASFLLNQMLKVNQSLPTGKSPSMMPPVSMSSLMAFGFVETKRSKTAIPLLETLKARGLSHSVAVDVSIRIACLVALSSITDVAEMVYAPEKTLHSALAVNSSLDFAHEIAELISMRQLLADTQKTLTACHQQVDMDRMAVDSNYARDALHDLVQSAEISEINAAILLAPSYHVPFGDLLLHHIRFAFRSIKDDAALSSHVDRLCESFHLFFEASDSPFWTSVLDEIDGRDYCRLALQFKMRSRAQNAASTPISNMNKHVSLLERLRGGNIVLDYKVLMQGGISSYQQLHNSISDSSVSILLRLAPWIRELQEQDSTPPITSAQIIIDYLSASLSPLSHLPPDEVLVQLYGQYLAKLPPSSFVELVKAMFIPVFIEFGHRYLQTAPGIDRCSREFIEAVATLRTLRALADVQARSGSGAASAALLAQVPFASDDLRASFDSCLRSCLSLSIDFDELQIFISCINSTIEGMDEGEEAVIPEYRAVRVIESYVIEMMSVVSADPNPNYSNNGQSTHILSYIGDDGPRPCPPNKSSSAAASLVRVFRVYPGAVTLLSREHVKAAVQDESLSFPARAALSEVLVSAYQSDLDEDHGEVMIAGLCQQCWPVQDQPDMAVDAPVHVSTELAQNLIDNARDELQICACATIIRSHPGLAADQSLPFSLLQRAMLVLLPSAPLRFLHLYIGSQLTDPERFRLNEALSSVKGLSLVFPIKTALLSSGIEFEKMAAVRIKKIVAADELEALSSLEADLSDFGGNSVIGLSLSADLISELVDTPVAGLLFRHLRASPADALRAACVLCAQQRFMAAAAVLDASPRFCRDPRRSLAVLVRQLSGSRSTDVTVVNAIQQLSAANLNTLT